MDENEMNENEINQKNSWNDWHLQELWNEEKKRCVKPQERNMWQTNG